MHAFIIVIILFLLSLANVFAQEQNIENNLLSNPVKVTRITGGIVFDGRPDEAVWQNLEPFPLVMYMPVPGNPPGEESVIRIAYDEEFLWVSALLKFRDITKMRAISKQRDYNDLSTDFFGFTLDTYNDRRNAVQFYTNPHGIRSDATIQNDVENEDIDRNRSWNTFWDVKTNADDQGWSAEFRIPLSSLRFQVSEQKTRMGILFLRWSPGIPELDTWPQVSPKYNTPYFKPSLSRVIEFEGLKPRKPVYLAPYAIGGIGQSNRLDESKTGWDLHSTFKKDAGLDVKYSLTNNLTADLTFNTDFAQVEADDQMINLSRYSLYFPEKRIFFLEKSDVFDFSFLEGNNLFYSRRIGLYEGNAVRIYGGARLTGRIGNWDVGLLDMQTKKFEDNPSENFGVLRLKREILNRNSFIGGMFTSRLGMNGNWNSAYGLDGQFRVKGDEYLIFKMAQSVENEAENKVTSLEPARLLFQWQRRSNVKLGYDLRYTYAGENYNPGMGFERKLNYHGPVGDILYGWLTDSSKLWRYHRITLSGLNYWNSITGNHETTNASLIWHWEAKKLSGGNVEADWYIEDLPDTLTLGNNQAHIPPGRYAFPLATISYQTNTAHKLFVQLSATAGQFYDGRRFSFFAGPKLKIGTDFDFGLTWYLDHVNFPERDLRFTNHIFKIRGQMTLTTKTSLTAFIQSNTAYDLVMANVRFRYNPREGNDFYIVYDETFHTDRNRTAPPLPFTAMRTILLKYTYTFRL